MFLITPRHRHRTQVSPNRSQDSTESQKFLTPLSLSFSLQTSGETFSLHILQVTGGNWPMAAPRTRSGRSTSLRDSDTRLTESEKIEGAGSWDALEWTKVEVIPLYFHFSSLQFNSTQL